MITRISKWLSVALAVMGLVHIGATFTPVISGKLATLNEAAQQAFVYMSLMCGALLVLGGMLAFLLADKVKEHVFLCKPYWLILTFLAVDGVLALVSIPHNPCAWAIFVLSVPLFVMNFLHR